MAISPSLKHDLIVPQFTIYGFHNPISTALFFQFLFRFLPQLPQDSLWFLFFATRTIAIIHILYLASSTGSSVTHGAYRRSPSRRAAVRFSITTVVVAIMTEWSMRLTSKPRMVKL
ncbi:uncharacterized protein [Euphorbia lathyris]|uniref:uncharacterized protein n=1 Tax=Euphorbia lathyris TaxID=212925 RepID=UPI0033141A30